jgi:hypothetical protein
MVRRRSLLYQNKKKFVGPNCSKRAGALVQSLKLLMELPLMRATIRTRLQDGTAEHWKVLVIQGLAAKQ